MNNNFKKRIIMIHGLSSKPQKDSLLNLWIRCILENIRLIDPEFAKQIEIVRDDVFKFAYWANSIPHHICDDSDYVKQLSKEVDKLILKRKSIKDKFHVGVGNQVYEFFQDKGADLVKLLAGALSVKEDVMKRMFYEIKLYDSDQYIADKIRSPLEDELRKAWQEGCDVALISHSMGTFVAYDVLWRFSHRDVDGFREYRREKIQLFVTLGSPLGDPAIRKLLFSRHHSQVEARQFPNNIDFWHNYACLGDVVSHSNSFEDIFFRKMKQLKILAQKPEHRVIEYVNLHNPFEVVSHSGNKGKIKNDPHKSYGYLVQPRLGSWLIDFLKGDLEY